MNEKINKFRNLLIKNSILVSDLEYTQNNYDNHGELIKSKIPTITTNFCEIGLYDDNFYFVFIIDPKNFTKNLFSKFQNMGNVQMYGFKNFTKTLYPKKNFDLIDFINKIQKEKYLQIQFDYTNISVSDLFQKYLNLVKIFQETETIVIDQLNIDLTKQ